MDRREFVKAALIGTTISSSGWAACAADGRRNSAIGHAAIVTQRGAPHALELAERLRFGLACAGIEPVTWGERVLHDYTDISELLSHRSGTWLIGITQDAPAVLTQAIAATQGGTCMLHVQHRIESDTVRHRCTTPIATEVISWSERRSHQASHLGSLYAGMLGANPLSKHTLDRALYEHATATGASASLVSFLIRL